MADDTTSSGELDRTRALLVIAALSGSAVSAFCVLAFVRGPLRVPLLIAFAAEAAVFVFLAVRFAGRRERAYTTWAASRGWSYTPIGEVHLGGTRFEGGDLITGADVVTDGSGFYGIMARRIAGPAGWGLAENEVRAYVLIAGAAGEAWLHVARGTHQLAHHQGHKVDFESEAFNRHFDVWTSDPRFASDLLSARLLERILQSGLETLTVDHGHLIVRYRAMNSRRNLVARHDEAMGMHAEIPGWAWR